MVVADILVYAIVVLILLGASLLVSAIIQMWSRK